MRYIMNKKGIDSLESLRQQALENGVEFIACQMSMDVMGSQTRRTPGRGDHWRRSNVYGTGG